MDGCDHDEESRIDDEVTGDEICTLCGLVMGRLYTYPTLAAATSQVDSPAVAPVAGPIVSWKGNRSPAADASIFTDTCHLFELGDGAAAEAAEQCKYLSKRLMQARVKYQRHILELYSIYHTMVKRQSSWSLTNYAARVAIHPKKLWKLEVQVRKLGFLFEEEDDAPANYVDSICYHLGLDRLAAAKARDYLSRAVDDDATTGCRPRNIAAATIFHVCGKEYGISLKKICNVTQCNASSISRLARRMSSAAAAAAAAAVAADADI